MSKMHKFTRPTSNQNKKKPGKNNFSKSGEFNENPYSSSQFDDYLNRITSKNNK